MRIGRYNVIAMAPSAQHASGLVILASTTGLIEVPDHTEYVTGVIHEAEPLPREWFWGHYFSTKEYGARARAKAVEDFEQRSRSLVEMRERV